MFSLHVCLCTMCRQSLQRPEEGIIAPILEKIVSNQATGNQTWVLWKSGISFRDTISVFTLQTQRLSIVVSLYVFFLE